MIKISPSLVLLILLSSCDPGYSVTITNNSSSDATIKILTGKKTYMLDSIPIFDSSNISGRQMMAVAKDVKAKTFIFILEEGKSTVLRQGIGRPDLSEKIVVNSLDTIQLTNDKRVVETKNGISTDIQVRLK